MHTHLELSYFHDKDLVIPSKASYIKVYAVQDFLGGPGVTTLYFLCRGAGSMPRCGTKNPHTALPSQKKKKVCHPVIIDLNKLSFWLLTSFNGNLLHCVSLNASNMFMDFNFS